MPWCRCLAAAAVLAGSRGFTAIGEWVLDASPQVLAAFEVRRDPLTGTSEPPDEATIRRVLEDVDTDVQGKTNEITRFRPLLEPGDLAGAVITADALHTQREHAEFLLTQKDAHYILVVKKNQPSLYSQVKGLP